MLFEFYDPLLEAIHDPENPLSEISNHNEDIQQKLRELMAEERRILEPLYRGRALHWQGNAFGAFMKSGIYRILDHKGVELPWFGGCSDWDLAISSRICGKLWETDARSQDSLKKVIKEWFGWLRSLGENLSATEVSFNNDDFWLACDFGSPGGDACMALYAALLATRKSTSVRAAGFFEPSQRKLSYTRIGKPGQVETVLQE